MSDSRNEFFQEMSIREIWTQAHFALISYHNIDFKASHDNDLVFSSIHSFLSHCACISRLLKPFVTNTQRENIIGEELGVPDTSIIHNTSFRNDLEHYDERLKKWVGTIAEGQKIISYSIGNRLQLSEKDVFYLSFYDPKENIFTYLGQDLNLEPIRQEVEDIKNRADKWVKLLESLWLDDIRKKGLIARDFFGEV